MKKANNSATMSHDEVRLRFLRDPKEANIALKIAVEEFQSDGDMDALLDTLRLIAQAQGGIALLARKTKISRKAVHEALSPDGNPRLRTFQTVLDALGLRMILKPVRRAAAAR
jgi:probable addiction module antidote protein